MKLIYKTAISSSNLNMLIQRPNWKISEPSLSDVINIVHRGKDAISVFTSGDLGGSKLNIFDGKPHVAGVDIIAYEKFPKFENEKEINVYHTVYLPILDARNGYDFWSLTYSAGARVGHYPQTLEEVIKVYSAAMEADVDYIISDKLLVDNNEGDKDLNESNDDSSSFES